MKGLIKKIKKALCRHRWEVCREISIYNFARDESTYILKNVGNAER